MSFPPEIGARYRTAEGRIWVVASVNETGMDRAVRFTTEGRDGIDEQQILEEEFDGWEAASVLLP